LKNLERAGALRLMKMAMKHNTQADRLAWLERELSGAVASIGHEQALVDAMNYSLLAGGKRLRPMMLLNAALMLGGSEETALPFAMALGVETAFAKRFGKRKLPPCPYFTCGVKQRMTAEEWIRFFRETANIMDSLQHRLEMEKYAVLWMR